MLRLPNNGWHPRPDQLPAFSYLEHGGTLCCLIAHRRWGKDEVMLHRTACAAHERIGVYWHMLPEAKQARKAIWNAVNPHTGKRRIDEAFPHDLRESTQDNEMFIRFKSGSTWQVVGSDNFDSLVGSPPIGITFSEWALADPRSWGYMRPIIRENKGWAAFLTTPRGHNHAENTLKLARENPNYFAQVITASDSKVFTEADLAQERRELILEYGQQFGEAIYEQEYNCSFNAAVLGSYYGYLMDALERAGRIVDFDYDDEYPVLTFWDLGRNDHMAIWFVQFVGTEIRWLDYESGSGTDLDDYIKVVREKPYRYGGHFGPHDLRVKELTRGKTSRIEYAADQGFNFKIVPNLSIADGRQALRSILKRSIFHKTNCENGISALQQHRADWDAEKKILSTEPVKDWTCHGADAGRYVGVQWKSGIPEEAKKFERKEMLFSTPGGGIIRSNKSILQYVQDKERQRRNAD